MGDAPKPGPKRVSPNIIRSEHFIAEREMVRNGWAREVGEDWTINTFVLKDGIVEAEGVWYHCATSDDCEALMMAFEDAYARLTPTPEPSQP